MGTPVDRLLLALLNAAWAACRAVSEFRAAFASLSAFKAIPRGSVALGLFRAALAAVNAA